jgi:hypothetical protein
MMLSQLRASRGATAPWSASRLGLARPLQTPPAAWLDPRRAAAEQQQQKAPPARDADASCATPPPTKLLEQTAQHLIELNKRRAELEEQNAVLLREKHELSNRLARAEADLAQAAEELSRAQAAATAATTAATAAATEAATTPAPSSETAPEAPAPPPSAFTIEYHSGWPRAFAHYCPRGGSWTSAPGKPMQRRPRSDDGARHVFVLELDDAGDALEFALTDGAGEWDNGGGSNYRVEGRGFAWRVRSGRVERI